MRDNNDELKRELAKLLWTNGFGDDPFRNWNMAERMIIEDGFLAWRRVARWLREHEARSEAGCEEYEQALNDFLTGVAYWIYATSLGTTWPSHDPETNWRIAQALKDWLPGVEL